MRVLLLIILSTAGSIKSQNVLEIIDQNNSPIKDVIVFEHANAIELLSNKQGEVILPKYMGNTLNLSIFKTSFKSQVIEIKFEEETRKTITLLPLKGEINTVEVNAKQTINSLKMRAVEGMSVYESKKSEKIILDNLTVNLAANNNRQIFAKVAGINIWESVGSGLSTEIGGRGLSPERSSNFNVRQNGYDISADALGYPDAYYVPPADAVQQIEITRGASSLQYGTQFGGIVNYEMQEANVFTPIRMKIKQTYGSYGFSNTHLQLDGTHKKIAYIHISQFKRGNGWRDNSAFYGIFSFSKFTYNPSEKTQISAEYTYHSYLAQQAGGLTDKLFEENDKQSIRDRNFFRIGWHLPQIELNHKFSSRLKMQSITFGLIARRDALGFLGNITRVDPQSNRDLLVDLYKNVGNETRVLFKYNLAKNLNSLLIGCRLYRGNTNKKQGLGDDGVRPVFEYINPEYLENSAYAFPSRNIALFAENIFHFGKWSLTPGIRLENISTNASGYYREISRDLSGNILVDTSFNENINAQRTFVISGLGSSFRPSPEHEIYTSISQNYRAVNFNDLRIVNPNFKVDPSLQDEKGFNADLGFRGTISDLLAYDLSLFYLYYSNRIGFTLEYDSTLFNIYRFRTNISDSRNMGMESVLEFDFLRLKKGFSKDFSLKQLLNFSYIDGRYLGSKESAFRKNKVELVPNIILKTSLVFSWRTLNLSMQYSYIGKQYTDATNSEQSGDAVNGIIPSYQVIDLTVAYKIKNWTFKGSVNNMMNTSYFTRRAAGYPGPGIIPADRRTLYISVGYEIHKK